MSEKTNNDNNVIAEDIVERTAVAFLSYANYVIEDRAIPKISDGLKPVHRRILYSMHCLGLRSNGQFKKSARTVGDVLGKFHPHGDSSVYGAMVGLAQDFNMRYPLIIGHGNFGSIDGDSAAAMRYTEAKLSPIGELMLRDINKDTVDMQPNFDESETEPYILPSLFPALLANGSSGIAVGLASSLAPHNASDIFKALDKTLKDALNDVNTNIEDLINIIKAPDFPTGGQIVNIKEVRDSYRTGHGKVIIRSKYIIEDDDKGNKQIVITEIPYKVNKANMVIQIDNLSKETDDIKEIRDESDKDGIRVVIELKKGANIQWVIKKLLKHTDMQSSFSINNVALIDGKPVEKLSLKDLIDNFLIHATNVIRRRTIFDLNKAQAREHIVDGILICLNSLDKTINIIRKSESRQESIDNLMSEFDLSEKQANAVIDMRLYSISKAPIEEYTSENDLLTANITKFQHILNDKNILLSYVRSELKAVSELFHDDRLTEISQDDNTTIDDRDLVKEETLVITYTDKNIIKAVKETEYTAKGRRTKGSRAGKMKENETIKTVLTVNSKDDILFITNTGRCHVLPVYKIPVVTKIVQGKNISNYLNLEPNETIINIIAKSTNSLDSDLLFVTRNGRGKRLSLDLLSSSRSVTKVISFKEDDELVSCMLVKPSDEFMIFTKKGVTIKIRVENIRPSGKLSLGVNVITLREKDAVIETLVASDTEHCLIMTEKGISKRCKFSDFITKSRGGKGSKAITLSQKTGIVVSAISVNDNDDMLIITKNGNISRISINDISILGKQATGLSTIKLSDDDVVVAISKAPRKINEDDIEEESVVEKDVQQ